MTVLVGVVLAISLVVFGRTVPKKNNIAPVVHHEDDGHEHGPAQTTVTIDSILFLAKKQLTPEQTVRINRLENSISRGDIKNQEIHVYHQLARFWADSVGIFEPFAWYTAEAARLENSKKNLNFAARLFLENLQTDEVTARRQWKALQAKDLFERSLKLQPDDDSAKVGLGATYLFGDIATTPMQGIVMIKEVVDKDSTNEYALMMLAKGSLISGQYDKAIERLETINRTNPKNLDALLLLAEVNERMGKKNKAIKWYELSLPLATKPALKAAIEKRIQDLK